MVVLGGGAVSYQRGTPIQVAFDLMTLNLADLPSLPAVLPAVEALSAQVLSLARSRSPSLPPPPLFSLSLSLSLSRMAIPSYDLVTSCF